MKAFYFSLLQSSLRNLPVASDDHILNIFKKHIVGLDRFVIAFQCRKNGSRYFF